MKKGIILFSTTIVCLGFSSTFNLNKANFNNVKSALDPITYNYTPRTSPDGKLIETVNKFDFESDKSGISKVINLEYNQDTVLYEYGVTKQGSNSLYYMNLPGGDVNPRLLADLSGGINVVNSTAIMYYVDFSNLVSSDGFEFAFDIESSVNTLTPTPKQKVYLYSLDTFKWETTLFNNEKRISFPEKFKGFVYTPISSYTSNNANVPNYTSALSVILNRINVVMNQVDKFESQSPIYFDDLTFVKEGMNHSHNYEEVETIEPSCLTRGYTVNYCKDCNEYKMSKIVNQKAHMYGDYYLRDGVSFRICKNCNHVETFPNLASGKECDEEMVTIKFNYSEHPTAKERKVILRKGSVISYQDVPVEMKYENEFEYVYQFSAWTSDPDNIYPVNPIGAVADKDMTYYARYNISAYNDKYYQFVSNLSRNGGVYNFEKKVNVAVLGNSNSSLYETMERDFERQGIPGCLNDSIAGSTSYDLVNYLKPLVLSYQPKFIVLNMSTNDMAYYFLSENTIINNMKKCYEMAQKYLPNSYVIITSALPLPGRTEFLESIMRLNDKMDEWTEKEEMIQMAKTFDLAYEYAKQYPAGWTSWTHMDNSALGSLFVEVVNIIKDYAKEHNIKF